MAFGRYNDKAVPLDDLEVGQKHLHVTTIPVSQASERPMLGRRQTSSNISPTTDAQKAILKGEEDTLGKVSNIISKIHSSSIIVRYALYILPVGGAIAVPLALLVSSDEWKKRSIDLVPAWLFCVWLEIIWVGLWLCKLVVKTFPPIWQATGGVVSAGLRKYSTVLKRLEIPLSILLWTITAFASTNILKVNPDLRNRNTDPKEQDAYDNHGAWVDTLSKVFKASIVVAAVLVAEKTIIQLVSINYHRKQYEHKIKQSKKLILLLDMLYDASRRLFPEFCPEFQAEDAEIHGNAVLVREGLARAGLRSNFVTGIGRAGDKVTAAFGAMASDITGKQVFNSTSAHAVVIEALETERASKALARRLWLSFVGVGKDALYKDDLIEVLGSGRTEEAEAIFAILDRDENGDVSMEEMQALIVQASQERRHRSKSIADIAEAIGVLDRLLMVVFLIAMGFIYAAFFSNIAASTTQLWSTFTGLAFAIGGTVTEFLSCCIFLFVKHPFDVGDRVDIDKIELIVEHISLMYSVFRRVDSDKSVQVANSVLNTQWVENVSRSGAQKERFVFSVSAATSADDLALLREQLEDFVTADEHRRDFKSNVDIHLTNIGDLKSLELRVEVRYKSNLSDEILRQTRRNKFMCEVLAIMRRIPIEPPGGTAPAVGDYRNPGFSVSVTAEDAVAAREKHAEETKLKKFVPPVTSPFEAVTTALSEGLGTVTGRRASVGRPQRRSFESLVHRR